MGHDRYAMTLADTPAELVGILREGVPVGLFQNRTEAGYLLEDGRWTVEVKDNGDGFPIEKKEEIMEKCREGMKDEKALSSQIDGMGLVNVFVRLKLFFTVKP